MSQTKEEHLADVIRYYDVAEAGYLLYQDDFYKLLDIYRGELPQRLKEELAKNEKSHLAYRKAKAITDRFHAGVKSTYFSNDQFANVGSYDVTEEAEALAKARQKAFDFHWKHTIHPYRPFNQSSLEGGIYGTGASKVYWDSSKDTPKMEHVSVHDVWFDPDASSIEDARFIIHRFRKSKMDIVNLKKAGIFNGKFDIESLSLNSAGGRDGTLSSMTTTDHSRIELFDIYYKRNTGWFVSTVHQKSVLLRREVKLNDGQPFIVGNIKEQMWDNRESAVRIYGDTFLSSIDTLQMELNARVNQQLDAIALNNNPKYFTETATGLDDRDLKTGAGRQVILTNIALKEQIPPPSVPMLSQDVDRIALHMEEATGIKSLTGDSQSAMVNRQTAHGMEILSNESNVMPDSYIRSWNETFVEPLISRMIDLIWKHSTRSWLFKNISRITKEDFFVSVNAGLGSTSRSIQIQGNDKLFQQFMAVQDMENARRVIKDTLPLYGKKNVTKYFPTEEGSKEQREEMQAKMQQEQEERMQLEKQELIGRIEENKAQATMYMANAQESEANKQVKLAKAQAEIKIMMEEIELKRMKLEHEMDKELQDFDFKDRELSIKELDMMRNQALQDQQEARRLNDNQQANLS